MMNTTSNLTDEEIIALFGEKDEYCRFTCEKGCKAQDRFIEQNNSAFDAVIDMHFFLDNCRKTCERCLNKEKYLNK